MHRVLIVASLSLLCSGCVFAQEQPQQFAAADGAWCQSRGAKPGSDHYTQCQAAIERQRQITNAESFSADANQRSPLSYDVPVPVQQPIALSPAPVVVMTTGNCVNTPVGNSFSSSCY